MFADLGGTTALPDNGVLDRFAGFFFPDLRGFTLVRITASCNLIGTDLGFRQHFYQRGALGVPDFHWVVFYPAWFWVELLLFALRHAIDIGIVIHSDRAGAGGALVERNDIFFFSHVELSRCHITAKLFVLLELWSPFLPQQRYRKANGDQSVCDRQMHLQSRQR